MLTVSRQCELIDLGHSSLYYQPAAEDSYNLLLMRLLDEQFTRTPFYGVPKMTAWLRMQGHQVNPKRIRRLLRLMGLEAVYPKPRLSIPSQEHKHYPYLLRNLVIDRPDQVWAADITYIRLRHGFVYLVAIMDWYSRYVLAWELSTTLDAAFCVAALNRALRISKPGIFNTDQGTQFTGADFTDRLEQENIRISMDGRGRVQDNIFVERLWRSVKYEEVYLHDYGTVADARNGLTRYFLFYNRERIHEALGYRTPYAVYVKEPKPLNLGQAVIMH
jgi:putative transposase